MADLRTLLIRDYAAADVVLTASGTAALHLALRVGMLAAGGPRIAALPAYACYDVATAALGVGAQVTFYDIDPLTLAPDIASLDAALRLGARVVVVAPLHGVPLDWATLEAVAVRYGAVLIEDAAQGHGASWQGNPLGSLGRLSTLSFGRGKGWTGGSGGALLWRGGIAPAQDVRDLPAPPRGAATKTWLAALGQCLLARPRTYGLPAALPWLRLGETIYREPATAVASTPMSAALVLASRAAALAEAQVRRERGDLLHRRLRGVARLAAVPYGGVAGWLRLPVRVPHAAATVRTLGHLGVAPGYPSALPDLPALRGSIITGTAAAWNGAASLVRELITLPTHSQVTDSEFDEIAGTLGGY